MSKLKDFLGKFSRKDKAKLKKAICKACDIAPSTYSRKLNEDNREFNLLQKEKIAEVLSCQLNEKVKQEDLFD